MDITIIALVIFSLFKLKFRLKKPPLWLLGALIFVAIATLSLILSPLNLHTIQYLNSFAYTLRLLTYILLGWVIYSGALIDIRENTIKILSFSGLGLAALGLLQLIFLPNLSFLQNQGWDPHFFRTASTLLDPNFTGAYLVLTMLVFAVKAGGIFPKKLLFFLFALVYLAFITTFSRSSALLLLAGFSSLAFFKRSVKLFLLGFLLFLGFFLVFNTYQKSVALPRNIDREHSAQARLDTWQQGFNLFQKSPILGVGFNSYRYALDQYELGPSEFLQNRGSSTNDSSLLYVLATTGILGLISYLGFLSLTFRHAILSKKDWGFVLSAALAGLLPNSFFVNSLFYPWIFLWVILLSAKVSTDR